MGKEKKYPVRPLGSNFCCEEVAEKETEIYIPDSVKMLSVNFCFKVTAVGEECKHVKVGDIVRMNENAVSAVKKVSLVEHCNVKCNVFAEGQVKAVLE